MIILQGELVYFHLKFTDELLDTIINGVEKFLKGYCFLVFGENEAPWNFEYFFYEKVLARIDEIEDPLGLKYEFI